MKGTCVCTFIDSKLWHYRHHLEHQELNGQQNRCNSCLLRTYNPVDYWGEPWASQGVSFFINLFFYNYCHIILYQFQVHKRLIQHLYTLQGDHHNKSSKHLSPYIVIMMILTLIPRSFLKEGKYERLYEVIIAG